MEEMEDFDFLDESDNFVTSDEITKKMIESADQEELAMFLEVATAEERQDLVKLIKQKL